MPVTSSAEKCLSFINIQLSPGTAKGAKARDLGERPLVTISRQAGAGGSSLGKALADYLQAQSPKGAAPWTVFDRNLVEKVLEDHDLPARMARFLPEDRLTVIQDATEELLGLHPSSWHLIQQTTETILRLAEMGNVIFVGRGANVITRHLPNAFHVRLVGSLDVRAGNLQRLHGLSRKAAFAFIEKEDLARRRYIKKYFRKEIENPLLYDLVLNSDRIPLEEAARIVGDAVLRRAG